MQHWLRRHHRQCPKGSERNAVLTLTIESLISTHLRPYALLEGSWVAISGVISYKSRNMYSCPTYNPTYNHP